MLIGDVARRSGVSARMLRHYESLGLVRPTGRTSGGYREYSDEDVRRLFQVESLRSLGLSLRQISRALQDPTCTPAGLVGDLITWTEERLERERELLDRLRVVDASAPSGWQGVLRIIELMTGINSPSAALRQQSVLAPAEDVRVPAELLAGAVLAESDPNVAGALRWALGRVGGDALASLASGVHSENVDIRRRAIQAVADLAGDEARAVLVDALDDPDPEVRRHAALALGTDGEVTAVPALVDLVVEGVNDVQAAEFLGALAEDPAHAKQIMSVLSDELAAPTADSAVRSRLTQAILELPRTVAQPVLRRLSHDDDPVVALTAAAYLGDEGSASR
ncbi:HEAT repeat domain-containing protein [Salinispora arenicola]|uniref:HEAT repeat domain-containing protein n=1 Tax=Salinispora arenicola TaxID=168697 RepID=UPI00048D7283|nr:HEAT repeat domain-containing protein [Salinispora arenicola]MCN0153034.1 MerR family transcriptional regulator [Salinispora arenicola]